MRRVPQAVLIGLISLYQRTLSRLLPPVCRFRPSCSEYAIQAIRQHGVVRGLVLGLCRIVRCNPFCQGGDDPVPASPAAGPGRTDRENSELMV